MAIRPQDAATPLLREYAKANCRKLHLDPDLDIRVAGFHSSYRVAPDGQLLIDIVAQFEQCKPETSDEKRRSSTTRWDHSRNFGGRSRQVRDFKAVRIRRLNVDQAP